MKSVELGRALAPWLGWESKGKEGFYGGGHAIAALAEGWACHITQHGRGWFAGVTLPYKDDDYRGAIMGPQTGSAAGDIASLRRAFGALAATPRDRAWPIEYLDPAGFASGIGAGWGCDIRRHAPIPLADAERLASRIGKAIDAVILGERLDAASGIHAAWCMEEELLRAHGRDRDVGTTRMMAHRCWHAWGERFKMRLNFEEGGANDYAAASAIAAIVGLSPSSEEVRVLALTARVLANSVVDLREATSPSDLAVVLDELGDAAIAAGADAGAVKAAIASAMIEG